MCVCVCACVSVCLCTSSSTLILMILCPFCFVCVNYYSSFPLEFHSEGCSTEPRCLKLPKKKKAKAVRQNQRSLKLLSRFIVSVAHVYPLFSFFFFLFFLLFVRIGGVFPSCFSSCLNRRSFSFCSCLICFPPYSYFWSRTKCGTRYLYDLKGLEFRVSGLDFHSLNPNPENSYSIIRLSRFIVSPTAFYFFLLDFVF